MNGERRSSAGDEESRQDTPKSSSSSGNARKWVRFDDTAGPETVIDETFEEQSRQRHHGDIMATQVAKGHNVANGDEPHASPRRLPPIGKERSDTDAVAHIDVKMEDASPRGSRVTLARGVPKDNQRSLPVSNGTQQQAYPNGKTITSIMPDNKYCTWFSPAHFDPYKMPKSLVNDPLTMPVEDYVTAMEMFTNDFRFRLYTVCYRRLIASWLLFCLFVLIIILISGLRSLTLFGVTLIWLFIAGVGVLGCLYVKRLINDGLQTCVASVNKLLMRYNLLVGMEDRGKLSCHKVVILFIYFDVRQCLPKVIQMLNTQEGQRGIVPTVSSSVDPSLEYGRNWSQEEKAENLILKSSQSYVKALVRHTIRFPSRPSEGMSEFTPLHCGHSYCLCQYLQKFHFEKKPRSWCSKLFLTPPIVDPSFNAGFMP